MLIKILEIIVNFLWGFTLLKDLVSWVLENVRLPLKKTVWSDVEFQKYHCPWFMVNPDSHGAVCFTKRAWSLTWLFSPRRISHVAVWDYGQQRFLDYDFSGNRDCPISHLLKEATELFVFKTGQLSQSELVSELREAQLLNTDNKLLCTGLLNEANNNLTLKIFEPIKVKNPAPSTIMERIERYKLPFIHCKV